MNRHLVLGCAAVLLGGPLQAQKGDMTHITAADIAAQHDIKTAWDAINRIRPAFFRLPVLHDANTAQRETLRYDRKERSLFVDGAVRPALDDLKEIPVEDVVEIKLMTPNEVLVRYGEGHPYGGIELTTNRRKH